jgi:hypothetical protein
VDWNQGSARQNQTLTKLRPKPQVSAAFRCSSIGIHSDSINLELSWSADGEQTSQAFLQVRCDFESCVVTEDTSEWAVLLPSNMTMLESREGDLIC